MPTKSPFVELKTIDNTRVTLVRNNVAGIEGIPSSTRTEAYTKIYAGGVEFKIPLPYEEVLKLVFEIVPTT